MKNKKVFFIATIIGSIIFGFFLGIHSAEKKNSVYQTFSGIRSDVEDGIKESPNLIRPIHFLQPIRYKGEEVTINDSKNQNDFVFLSGFFENGNELRLIRRDGSIVNRWPVKYSELLPDTSKIIHPPATDWNIDIHGALALADGSVVFNFEYGGLVKLDRCGEVVWILEKNSHHSVTEAEGGGFWVPGRNYYDAGIQSPFPPFSTPLYEDTIMKVSDDGNVLDEISVPGLFYSNQLESLLTSSGELIESRMKWDQDIVHLNQIIELKSSIASDFPMFEVGDLMISLRKFNLLMVLNPVSRKVKWWKIGPWKRQHDPEFLAGGKLTVFNNNHYSTAFGRNRWKVADLDVQKISNIIEYDFVTDNHKIVYGGSPNQEFVSVIRGKHEHTVGGGFLITDFAGGRVFETDQLGNRIWEYINNYDNISNAEITEAHLYSQDYFSVTNWSCPSEQT